MEPDIFAGLDLARFSGLDISRYRCPACGRASFSARLSPPFWVD
jgi:hypothetical protein